MTVNITTTLGTQIAISVPLKRQQFVFIIFVWNQFMCNMFVDKWILIERDKFESFCKQKNYQYHNQNINYKKIQV